MAYRHHPTPKEADELRSEFERLFGQSSDYEQLDKRKALTLAKKDHLLMVLSHPEILLHNNPAELGARQRVRKRDVSEASTYQRGDWGLGDVSDARQHGQEAGGQYLSVFA